MFWWKCFKKSFLRIVFGEDQGSFVQKSLQTPVHLLRQAHSATCSAPRTPPWSVEAGQTAGLPPPWPSGHAAAEGRFTIVSRWVHPLSWWGSEHLQADWGCSRASYCSHSRAPSAGSEVNSTSAAGVQFLLGLSEILCFLLFPPRPWKSPSHCDRMSLCKWSHVVFVALGLKIHPNCSILQIFLLL
jgi:hypothetical protein